MGISPNRACLQSVARQVRSVLFVVCPNWALGHEAINAASARPAMGLIPRPLGRGTGGPGYEYDGEFKPNTNHDRPGILGMPNVGPGTNGGQFFETFSADPARRRQAQGLDVVEGLETLKEFEKRGSRNGKTTEPFQITTATISLQ